MDDSSSVVDLLASTDIKEYLKRRGESIRLCIYERLFRAGIENYKQLIVEKYYPRSDIFRQLATTVVGAFPSKWENEVMSNIECNSDIDIRLNIVLENLKPVQMIHCSVKKIRMRLVKLENIVPKYSSSFNMAPHDGINPFLSARISNYASSQKIFKFRLLHGDIFTRERMFRFKMIDNDQCLVCNETETLEHAVWLCPRAGLVWRALDNMLESLNLRYTITFESLFIGISPVNRVLETLITKLTQSLLSYDRSSNYSDQNIKNIIFNYAIIHKYKFKRKNNQSESTMWENIVEWCKG